MEQVTITLTSTRVPREVGRESGSYTVSMLINPGIAISSTPIAVDDATADVAIFLMLGALRQITIPMTAIRDGLWEGEDTNRSRPERKDPGYIRNGWNRQSEYTPTFGVSFLTGNRQWQSELEPLV